MAHVAAAEPLRWLETDLFDGVEVVEVVALEEAIGHEEGRAEPAEQFIPLIS